MTTARCDNCGSAVPASDMEPMLVMRVNDRRAGEVEEQHCSLCRDTAFGTCVGAFGEPGRQARMLAQGFWWLERRLAAR